MFIEGIPTQCMQPWRKASFEWLRVHWPCPLNAGSFMTSQQGLLEIAGILGKRETEKRSAARFAFGPDFAAMALDDVFDNRQAQAGPALFARARFVHPIEPLE